MKLTKQANKYRKRAERLSQKPLNSNTPRSKMKNLTRGLNGRHEIKRALLFHNVLCETLREKYSITNSDREKFAIAKIITSKLMKKYKLKKTCQDVTGISTRRLSRSNYSQYRARYKSKVFRFAPVVKAFYERDDNSRITTSKKDTITRKGEKKQRRLLMYTLSDLHKKFAVENPDMKISYATFCACRPLWVVTPTARDRETCLCKLHENGRLIINKLAQLKVLPSNCMSVGNCVKEIVCNDTQEECYLRTCESCCLKDKELLEREFDRGQPCKWQQWNTIQENRLIKDKVTIVKRTVKQEVNGTVGELVGAYLKIIPSLCLHVFTISHQFNNYSMLKSSLSESTAVIVVDFSENYTCKLERAVQSSHFGASNNQLSLHTGVAYLKEEIVSFCTVSDCTKHEPAAIWAHLLPVLHHLKEHHPTLTTIHFWSDGPTTQYRNKHHMLLTCHYLYDEGFTSGSWNYFEAGHGKSAADAIGGTLKRTADQLTDHGVMITSAANFVQVLNQKTVIKLFLVSEDDIGAIAKLIPEGVKAVVGTMKLHQLQFIEKGTVSVRNFSCFCQIPNTCNCHKARKVQFGPLKVIQNEHENVVEIETELINTVTDNSELTANELSQIVSQPHDLINNDDLTRASNNVEQHPMTPELIVLQIQDWCIVEYDDQRYIGQVTDKDIDSTECEVSTLQKTGVNKFKYPAHEDKIWYKWDQIIKKASPPVTVSRRAMAISDEDWQCIDGAI